MKTWTEPPTLAALAVLFTLPLAGCTEDGPRSMIEADPETFDAETVYEIVPIGGTPSLPGEQAVFVQFDSEEAKRAMAEDLAKDARNQLSPLSADRAAQVWDNRRVVYAMGVATAGRCCRVHIHNPPTLREVRERQRRMYCPSCSERREVVRQ